MRLKQLKLEIENDALKLKEIVGRSKSMADLLKFYNFPENGKQRRYFWDILNQHNINTDHFNDIRILDKCGFCNKQIKIRPKIIENSKCKKAFCGKSCAAKHNNGNKKFGIRRSKLEMWLESKLKISYPMLEIHYNRKDTINSELDIYIPSLNLAFELNGIFHYEPIFGEEKLNSTKNNDNRKFQACLEKQIELCIIDVSSLTYFKDSKVIKYFDIISKIINTKYK